MTFIMHFIYTKKSLFIHPSIYPFFYLFIHFPSIGLTSNLSSYPKIHLFINILNFLLVVHLFIYFLSTFILSVSDFIPYYHLSNFLFVTSNYPSTYCHYLFRVRFSYLFSSFIHVAQNMTNINTV